MPSHNDELFEIDGLLVACLCTEIPPTQLGSWSAKLEAPGASCSVPGMQWIEVDRERDAQLRRSESSKRPSIRKARANSYLVVFTGADLVASCGESPVRVTLSSDLAPDTQLTLVSRPLSPERLRSPGFREALGRALQANGARGAASVLTASPQFGSSGDPSTFEITRLVLARAGLVLQGHGCFPRDHRIHIVTADLRSWANATQVAVRPEHPDQRQADAVTPEQPQRSFTAVLARASHHRQDAFYVVIVDPTGANAVFHGPFSVTAEEDEPEAAQLVREGFGRIQDLTPEQIDAVYRPILALPRTQVRARRFEFGPPRASKQPLASIIIPLYGDAFFLNCIFHLQRILHPGYELIVVVDDPKLWPEVYGRIAARQSALTVHTILLQCAENYGYAQANNIGFMAAEGDVIFLMNSDVLVTNLAALDEAATTIREKQSAQQTEAIVGFSLLFEDDTIQHIGMEFPRSPQVGNLHVAEHPMKGLPVALYTGGTTRQVPAVTGALVGMSARLYQSLGGFDAVYERGDFEDADLCLRARASGAQIMLNVRLGLYHLERQSLRRMGDASFREMITYLNCVTFNHRWSASLSQQVPAHDGAPGPIAEERRAIRVRKRQPHVPADARVTVRPGS
jgi:GT2 family glycosyltransferase